MSKLFFGFAILLLMVLQIHNIFLYPPQRGFDGGEHIEYIHYLQFHHQLPLPSQGWEMYHPPLYYAISSILPNQVSIQILGLISYLGYLILAALIFERLLNDQSKVYIGLLSLALLPMLIYLTPSIGNELFSGVMISLGFSYYVLNKEKLTSRGYLKLGILIGLALLSKSTAWVLLAAVLIDQLIMKKIAWITLTGSLLVGGWFYLRNYLLYSKPLVSNMDFLYPSQKPEPIKWNLHNIFDPSPFFKLDLFQAHHYALLAGVFFGAFYDGQNSLIPVQKFSNVGAALVITSIPLVVLAALGALRSLRRAETRIFIIYSVLLLASLFYYLFKYPYFYSVKGVYLVSLAIPYGYFVARGCEILKKYQAVVYPYLAIYLLLVIKNFWILKSWY